MGFCLPIAAILFALPLIVYKLCIWCLIVVMD